MQGRHRNSTDETEPSASPAATHPIEGSRSGEALDGQRRQVTVLFADMADYTPLAERLGEEQTYLLMQRVIREMSEAVHAQSGTVQEVTGDGVMALFGAPVALEDAPLRACRAALDIQARMAALDEASVAEHGARAQVRVGIHSGPLVVGEVGDELQTQLTALGDTVNLASRLESAAEPGTVLISAATQALVEGFVDSGFAGERALKGKSEPQKVWRLDAIKTGVSRFDVARRQGLTALIGRRRELELIDARWGEAEAGAIRAVNVVGEAGIGKSRLVFEFQRRLDEARSFLLVGRCRSDGHSTPFLPFIEVVRSSFRIGEAAGREETERRLRRGLEVLGLPETQTLPYLLNLLGRSTPGDGLDQIAGEVLGIRTREAIQAMLRERCRITPTVLFVDDLHWIDTASEQLLSRITSAEEAIPLLVLCTYRAAYRAPWSGGANVTELRLAPLSSGSTTDLLRQRLGTEELPEALIRHVGEKADGNPLFVEEITSYFLERGRLREGADGLAYEADGDASPLPVTLENLLLDRVDQLDPGPRATLEAASVIGPQFSADLLGAATGVDVAATGHLADLERQDLIRREPARDLYRFKHALVQDAVYGSLLSARRAALHEKVAEALEAQGRASDGADVLAHHWSRTSRTDQAVKYLAEAGENSLRIYSLEAAEERFRAALALIESAPGSADDKALADILLHLARILYFQGNFNAVIDLVARHLPRVEALGDKKRLSRFLFEGGYAHVFVAEAERGTELLRRALALGQEIGDDLAVAYAQLGLMWHRTFWGEPGAERRRTQREIGEQVVETGRRRGDIWVASKALLCLGLDEMGWGRPGTGRQDLLRLMALSRETNDPRPRTMALWALAALNLYVGDYEEALESADEAVAICLSPIDRLSARAYRACALILMGQAEAGCAALERERQVLAEGGLRFSLATAEMIYGTGMVMNGDISAGVRHIEETVDRFTALGQRTRPFGDQFLGESYFHMATAAEKPPLPVMVRNLRFLLTTLPVAKRKAERHLERAAAEFRADDMPAHLARCLYYLGLLEVAGKRPTEARARLEEAHALASSVEATALAKQAKTALDAL